MTFVSDQLRDLDAQLDRLQLDRVPVISEPVSPASTSFHHIQQVQQSSAGRDFTPTPHAKNLQRIVKSLSSRSSSQRLLSAKRLVALLKHANITKPQGYDTYEDIHPPHSQYEVELEWLLLSKATIQTYGIVLNSLVEQTLPLTQDLFYWDEILGSYRWTAWYSLTTTPQRILNGGKDVLFEASLRFKELRELERLPFFPPSRRRQLDDDEESILSDDKHSGIHHRYQPLQPPPPKPQSLTSNLRKFYSLVKNTLRDRSLTQLHRVGALSPFSIARHEIRKKQDAIRKLRELQASALGVLIGEGLSFEFEEEHDEWKGIIERTVTLMENVVRNVASIEHSVEEFEEMVFSLEKPRPESPGEEDLSTASATLREFAGVRPKAATAALSAQLQEILSMHLPSQSKASRALIATHGRPGIITRYWIPATALLLSSTTILRILVNRQAEIQTWLRELGVTIIDFWANWVIEPVRKIVGTIRHKADSEVALMSRSSLAADMDSLQRMVVDFAVDNPDVSELVSGGDELQLEAIKKKVKEGDLTPVLKAYEQDLRSPFKGAVRGELVRTLLIQVQKTKVDVEVAISGIDHLLRSQELVFGFLGLTPGVFVCISVFRYISNVLGRGQGRKFGKKSEQMLRTLRNVDRILTGSRAGSGREGQRGLLSYKEHGLLMCEIHVLREWARGVLPSERWGEFVADLEELGDVRNGIDKQSRVVERLRWAYGKWIK